MARRAEQGQAAGLVSPPIMQRTEGRGGDAPAFLLRFDRLFEAREPRRRGSRVGADPAVVDVLDRHRVEMVPAFAAAAFGDRSEEHTSELQSLMRNSYAVFCLKK